MQEFSKDFESKFTGPIGVLITPFDSNGKVDEYELEKEIYYLNNTRIKGYFACGSTGEFVHLTPQENKKILKIAAKKRKQDKTIVAGACSSNPQTVIDYLNYASDLGYDAAVVCPPYYARCSQEDIIDFYKVVCNAAKDIKIILYNIPAFTTVMEISTIEKLAEFENVAGIKDSSANIKNISHLVAFAEKRKNFFVLTGTDDALVPCLFAGCRGSMTALGACVPEIVLKIYDLIYAGDNKSAVELQKKILPLLRTADKLLFPLGYKLIMEARGMKSGSYKQAADNKEIEKVREEIKNHLNILSTEINGGLLYA